MPAPFLAPFLSVFLAADADAKPPAESFPVEFRAGAEGSKLAPRFSPKGTQVALAPKPVPGLAGFDHLEGRLRLGPKWNQGPGQLIVLARSVQERPYDLLFID